MENTENNQTPADSGVGYSDLLDFLDSLGRNNSAKWTLVIKPWGAYLDKSSSDGFETASDCLRDAFKRSNSKDVDASRPPKS